ncbi:MAG TPA: 2-hydroxyacyl-CoA dehydratase family protein, partial [Smithellaceae bacterium]|nr:2-hydroxyacyl-CoA dehydratase family protein [Smithellaceae bacterium]
QMKELAGITGNPIAYARRLQETSGKKIIGYMCSYAPEEIIHAAGAHPLRLFGSGRNILLADSHLQSYCCSLVRGVLEDALAGNLNYLTGMIFPHTCDTVQRLSDIWRLNVPEGFHLDIVLPVKLDTADACQYLIDVLHRFRDDLGKALQTKISDDDLRKSITLYNNIRNNLQKVYELRKSNPDLLSGRDVYALVKAAMIMDRESYLTILQAVVGEMQKATGTADNKKNRRKRLILSGGICSQPDIYSLVEDVGAHIAGDDLCTGSRYFAGQISVNGDPITAIAERYVKRVVCPAKHMGNRSRAENLLHLVKDCHADGVIFMLLKFCDPHAFDYPYLKKALDKEGLPCLLLEVEDQPQAQEQMKTRIEAFLETLKTL